MRPVCCSSSLSPRSSPFPLRRPTRARCATASGRAQERALAGAAARLGALERATAREVAILEGRVAAAQTELDAAVARQRRRQARLARRARRLARLRNRLGEVRGQLALVLRERYMGGAPDFVTVVLHADGFPQLLETRRLPAPRGARRRTLLDDVRTANADAAASARADRASRAASG